MGATMIGSSSGRIAGVDQIIILLDGPEDAERLPIDYAWAATGSMAISADLAYQAIKAGDGTWHQRAVIEAAAEAREAAADATNAAAEAREAAQEASSSAAAEAIAAANAAAAAANAATASADAAAAGAGAYAREYYNVDGYTRLMHTLYQAQIRALEGRVATLESRVAALAGH